MVDYLAIATIGSLVYIGVQKLADEHYKKQREAIINGTKKSKSQNKLEKTLIN